MPTLFIFVFHVSTKMNITKSLSVLLILLLPLTALLSCKNEKPSKELAAIVVKDTFPHFEPNVEKTKKLSKKYRAEKQATISAFYKKYWDKNKVSGGFLVAKDGQVIFEKYSGYAHFDSEKITSETPIHLASVSKILTAAAIMKLVEAGKITLDQQVHTILKDFPYQQITVRSLLNHRSGLTNYAYYCDDQKIWNQQKMLTNQDILDLFIKNNTPLDFVTNRKFAYCNTNYAMLALIIEKVSSHSFAEAMDQMIFKPLGMKNTFVIDFEKQKNDVSQSYKGNYKKHELDHLDQVYGDKNIYSTPRDLLKFEWATVSDDYLTPELKDEIYKGYSYEQRGTRNYGLGIRLIEWKNGRKLFYHNGWWHGNTSSYVKLKDENVVIIALANKYTTMTYKSFYLATIFGDYPLKIKKGDLGE